MRQAEDISKVGVPVKSENEHTMYSDCWYATIRINDIELEALVDSGAEKSLLSLDVFNIINHEGRYSIHPSAVKFRGIGGAQASLGICSVDLTIGERVIDADLHVIPLENVDCILGMDTLKKQDISFHLGRGLFIFNDGTPLQLCKRAKMTGTKVVAASRKTIKAKSACFISAKIPDGLTDLIHAKEGLVEPLQCVYDSKGLVVSCSLVSKSGNACDVYVMNPTDKDVEIEAGYSIASFSLATEVHAPGTSGFDAVYDIWRCVQVGMPSTESVDPLHEDCLDFKLPSTSGDTPPGCEALPAHLRCMMKGHELPLEQVKPVVDLLREYDDVFVGPSRGLGRTQEVEGHRIDTGDEKPIRQRLRRLPPKRRGIVEEFIQELLDQQCIRPSSSEWASPIVIVKKKDGSPRLCIDYRKVNAVTKKDAYPLPRIDDALDQLSGKAYFCTFDLASGYYQLPMSERDAHKTAFITHLGLFEWLVLPMGLSNSPATFQRCMNAILGDITDNNCLVYLDDIISFGSDFEDTLHGLRQLFARLRLANLRLKPKKCTLFQTEVGYLGHVVSREGIQTDPSKVAAVAEWETPKCIRDVRSFLGLASYYRKFIPRFATVAAPLSRLTEKNVKFIWTEDCQVAFDGLKVALTTAPLLAYPRETGKYIIDTDASLVGIGAVLSQIQEGEERVIAYASKSLSRSQRRYCTTKRELLAVVQFVTVTFRNYLAPEDEFIIRTDHASLRWLMNFREAEGLMGRWFQLLAEFHFVIQHRKGNKHLNADALSRAPPRKCKRDNCPECHPSLDLQCFTLLAMLHAMDETNEEVGINSHETTSNDLPLASHDLGLDWSVEDLIQDQIKDDDVQTFIQLKKKYVDEKPPAQLMSALSKDVKLYWTRWEEYELISGVLYRLGSGDKDRLCYVVPLHRRKQVLQYLHSNPVAGHFGVYRTSAAATRRFYWPRMRADIRRYVKSCLTCERAKAGPGKGRSPLKQEISGARNERIAFDIIGPLPESRTGNRYILTVGDYFSKYFIAVPLRRHTAEDVAEAIVIEWICKLGGCPLTIHSDRAPEFCSKVMKQIWEMLQIHHTKTLPYRPQSDGMVERFNGTIQQMLKCAIGKHKDRWDEMLPYVIMAYNATEQASTGCSPNLLCFGEELVMPVDLLYGCKVDKRPWVRPNGATHYFDYVEEKRRLLINAFSSARKVLRDAASRQERGFNVHLKRRQYEPGDWVLKWYKPAAEEKLGKGWVGPYVVTRVISEVAYEIQAHPKLKPKVVHVDYLKTCFAWQDKDNWVKNSDFICPPGRPMRDPEDSAELDDDVLTDREVANLFKGYTTSKPSQREVTAGNGGNAGAKRALGNGQGKLSSPDRCKMNTTTVRDGKPLLSRYGRPIKPVNYLGR